MGQRTPMRGLLAALTALVVLYLCFFSHLGALGLVGPDEPRYAAVAREMAQSGDWVTPRLNGKPWFEKPVLFYWKAAVAFKLFGVNEFSARLPSALAATLAALVLAWAGWRFYGAATGWATLLLFPTCVGVFGFARAAAIDMLFSASLALAIIAAARVLWHGRKRPSALALIAFGAMLGAATLAKGPAAIVLAVGSVGLWAAVTRRWREAFWLAHPSALVAYGGVALPWHVLCALRNPDFVQVFLISHNIERYLTPVFRHEQPFWFFGPVLLLGLVPWTVLLIGVARDARRRFLAGDWKNSPAIFFGCWVLFPLLFFSFSQSKLPGYILPVLPPLVLLMARSITRAIEEGQEMAWQLMAAVGGTFFVLAVSAGYWLKRLPPEAGIHASGQALVWMVVAAGAGLGLALLAFLRRVWPTLAIAALLLASLLEVINVGFIPRLDAHLSPRAAARAAQVEARAAETFYVYRLHRAWHYGLNFYFARELPQWTPEAPRRALVFTNTAGLPELRQQQVEAVTVNNVTKSAVLLRIER